MKAVKHALTALMLLLSASASSSDAHAQETRRRVPRGEVTGLEMGIDGSLEAIPGGTLRWFVDLYEVVGRRDLRPAPNVALTVTGSFAPGEPLLEIRTDAQGRARLEVPIPVDRDEGFRLLVRAESPRRVERTFSVDITLGARWEMRLSTDRQRAVPGGEVFALGRLVDRATARPVAGEDVTLTVTQSGAPTRSPAEVTTDAAGMFWARVPALDEPGALSLHARSRFALASAQVTVAPETPPTLWVEARPDRRVYAPGDAGRVRVTVRALDGRPIEGAELEWPGRDPEVTPPRTGPDGVATVPLAIPTVLERAWVDRSLRIDVAVVGVGTESIAVPHRVARVPWIAEATAEGGALIPELDGAVFVRVVGPDGRPRANEAITLQAPRLGGALQATTDDDGVARVSAPVAPSTRPDGCGGPTFTEAVLQLDGHSQSFCLPVDPDATLAVRGDGDGAFVVTRRSGVARAPVEVTALVRGARGWVPLSRTLLAPDVSRGELAADAHGEIWLRARPVLAEGRAVRGGGVLVYRAREGGALTVEAGESGARVDGGGSAFVIALPPPLADATQATLRADLGPVGAAIDDARSPWFVQALLAARTPRDVAATASLREGTVLPQPMPEEPVTHGLLRDPWRTRARFVRGRIGRMLRAVETYVDAAVPGHLEEVAVPEGRGYRFNQAILSAALGREGLYQEGSVSLDGEPLDAAALASMDRAFTYDHVARRVTRERLFRAHLLLRQLVHERGLDRPWALRGDPSTLLVGLIESADEIAWQTDWPQREHLFDAWGQPFVLRPVRGRARFTFLEPVRGWELVSVGPDGRSGTGDDMVDPFARVLPDGVYAEAVGEETLLARLGGVALGRATAEELAEIFGASADDYAPDDAASHDAQALPTPLPRLDDRAPLAPFARAVGGHTSDVAWSLPAGRRPYVAIAARFDPSGAVRTERVEFEAGAAWTSHLELPSTLRPGDRLRVPLVLTRLADAPPPEVAVRVRGGALRAERDGAFVVIEATRPGFARLEVVVGDPRDPIGRFTRRLRVVPDGGLRARHLGGMLTEAGDLRLEAPVPDAATPWRGQLVVGAPSALAADPRLADSSVAVVSWGRAMASLSADEALDRRLRREAGGAGDQLAHPVETACALSTWALSGDEHTPTAGAIRALSTMSGDDLAVRASVLAALAPAAPAGPTGGADAIGQLTARLRRDGWRTLVDASDRPDVMARMAAALLLVDRDDAPGRALLDRVQMSLTVDAAQRAWVPGADGRPSWAGTLAAALAARQTGDDALADRLAGAAATRWYVAARSVDATFWAVAASVYGALGVGETASVTVRVDGAPRPIALEGGVATLDVRPGAQVALASDAPVWAHVESRYLVPYRATEGGPLRVAVEGVVGVVGERAGLELRVESASGEVADPVVELIVPSAAPFDEVTRQSLARAAGVRAVGTMDEARVVRVHLESLPAGATRRIPLPFRWTAAGVSRGLDVAAYAASTPTEIWITEGRALEIREEPAR